MNNKDNERELNRAERLKNVQYMVQNDNEYYGDSVKQYFEKYEDAEKYQEEVIESIISLFGNNPKDWRMRSNGWDSPRNSVQIVDIKNKDDEDENEDDNKKDIYKIMWIHHLVPSEENYEGTLHGAKIRATKGLTYGTDVTVTDSNGNIWEKEFWNNLNHFGWDKWEKVL